MASRRASPAALLCAALAAGAFACATTSGSTGRDKGGLVASGVRADAVEAAARPRRVALLVGIDRYDDSFWTPLRFASKDANDLASALLDRGRGFDEVRVLATPEETTRERILQEIRDLAQRAPRAGDTVVLYLSGHGTLAPAGGELRRVLVARDTRHDDLAGTGLPMAELARRFDALPSQRKALVLATCHSGGGKSVLTRDATRIVAGLKGPASLEAVSRAAMVFAAADFGQPAREDDALANDVYTHFLVEALALGADANGDGAVSATEAHDYARRRTFEFTGGLQVPTVESMVVGADPVLLAGRVERPGLPVLFSYAPEFAGTEVRLSGQVKGTLPGNVVLEEGEANVELGAPGGAPWFRGPVTLRAGERVGLESLLASRVPRWTLGAGYDRLGLLSPGLSAQVMAPVAGVSLVAERRDVLGPNLGVRAMAAYGNALQQIAPLGTPVWIEATTFRAGLGLVGAREFGAIRTWAGPQVAFLRLARSFEVAGTPARQTFGTMLPGLAGGFALPLGRWELRIDGELDYLLLEMDGKSRTVAAGALTGGAGVRF